MYLSMGERSGIGTDTASEHEGGSNLIGNEHLLKTLRGLENTRALILSNSRRVFNKCSFPIKLDSSLRSLAVSVPIPDLSPVSTDSNSSVKPAKLSVSLWGPSLLDPYPDSANPAALW